MTEKTVSVIVVSRGRPDQLMRCLDGLFRLNYTHFEVVVVADATGVGRLQTTPKYAKARVIGYDEANISVARNLGIAASAGDIIAFIDDDAVPEPLWLTHLVAPFDKHDIAVAGGFVRGRNGISFQWRARWVDGCARTQDMTVPSHTPLVVAASPEKAAKTEGTNMAVRARLLKEMGGFDPAFKFYLDETDMNLRLASDGHATAIVPLAEVHHAYSSSARRAENRAVLDLYEIGASMAVFLRKHCPKGEQSTRWHGFQGEQGARLAEQVRRGLLQVPDVERLMTGLRNGYQEGLEREIDPLPPIGESRSDITPFRAPLRAQTTVIAGRIWQRKRLREQAKMAAELGGTVSLFLFSPSTRYHSVEFTKDGYWEQRGGLWGRSERNARFFQPGGFSARLRREVARVARSRGLALE